MKFVVFDLYFQKQVSRLHLLNIASFYDFDLGCLD